jgi:hypothetical protein
MPSELRDCNALREIHIYWGNPIETLGRGHEGETLISHRRRPEGSLMSQVKPHVGGGPKPKYL